MPNRLAEETSPYLVQHQDNPIDWQPWDDQALAQAKAENKPIFLSVGYSACHWCHVMAHESFEHPAVAHALNKDFISIKVDREERPDIDEIYMTAVQMATGHGGWPMTVFLTPDLEPFFAGTYFPREQRGEFPGFMTIVTSLAQAWSEQEQEVRRQAELFAQELRRMLAQSLSGSAPAFDVEMIDAAIEAMHESFDFEHGGFGGAPKFPPHTALRFLLTYQAWRSSLPMGVRSGELVNQARHMAHFTLEKMALSGLQDQVGGGFHRYATDEIWRLPHFEKMLIDNALLLRSYAESFMPFESEPLKATAEGIHRWAVEEMSGPDGLFYSALDADSEGEEGVFYNWSVQEIRDVLGGEADDFIAAFQCTAEGNFEDEATHRTTGQNVLHPAQWRDWSAALEKLRERRADRERPGLDDKALCGWNGLMISGLVAAGDLTRAEQCARTWRDAMTDGRPPHQITKGQAKGEPFLDDIAHLAAGYLDLAEAMPSDEWRAEADRLADLLISEYYDPQGGRFFFTSSRQTPILSRTSPMFDGAAPSPNSAAIRLLIRLKRWDEAGKALGHSLLWAQRMPHASETTLEALLLWLAASDRPEESSPAPVIAAPALDQIRVALSPKEAKVDKEGWAHVMVTLSLPAGLHINTNSPSARWLIPTTLKVEGVYGEAGFQESDDDRYEGEVNIPVRLRPKSGSADYELTIRYQPCTETECYEPQEKSLSGVVIVP